MDEGLCNLSAGFHYISETELGGYSPSCFPPRSRLAPAARPPNAPRDLLVRPQDWPYRPAQRLCLGRWRVEVRPNRRPARGDDNYIYGLQRSQRGHAGTEVWLAGRRVGLVQVVGLRPVTTDTSERVLIQMDILSQYMGAVRKNSTARIRPGTSLIAEPVVAITAGTTNTPGVQAGDTLRALSQLAKSSTPVDIASLGDSAVAVASILRQVASEARVTATGPIAALRKRTALQANAVERAIDQFSARTSPQWRGTTSRTSHDTSLHAAVARLVAQTDSVGSLMTSDHTTIGRFRRDSTLATDARHLLASTDQLRTRLSGSLDPRQRGDSALAQQLDRVQQQLDSSSSMCDGTR